MAKTKAHYVCQNCGQESLKWLGRCPGCGTWNSFVEEVIRDVPNTVVPGGIKPLLLDSVELADLPRRHSGSRELDRVLGGGIVSGSFVLVGGDPGIGKSTLLLQMMHYLARHDIVLYVSGEESANQIKLRANRLELSGGNLFLLAETNLEAICLAIEQLNPTVVVVDSIQTIYSSTINSAPGSVSQVRECAAILMRLAKEKGLPVFLVGHVTKEGALAGPRVLEHMVDTVIYFEGDRHQTYRIIRSVKNRFGATNEIGVFEMVGRGLTEIANPSELFLSQRANGTAGAVVTSAMEGTRPVLLEVQALVGTTNYAVPRRMATGMDYNRVLMLLAVLDKRVGLNVAQQDVFVNLVGGVKIEEPALDLAILLAITSSFRDKPIKAGTLVFGEVGLTGEVRGVPQTETRIKEALKLGFSHCIIPAANQTHLKHLKNITVVGVGSVREALAVALED